MPADLVVHADWSTTPAKRWAAVARRRDGRWQADVAHAVDLGDDVLLGLAGEPVDAVASVLVGVDAVIGLPRAYAQRVGVVSFRELLPKLGAGEWSAFFEVAETPEQISRHRPFYPARPGGTAKRHLADGLDLREQELLRRCEHATPHRPAASELFWTIGGKQVGKATIALWREVLQPLLEGDRSVRLWPFDGSLAELLDRPGVTLAETYPAEARTHLGLDRKTGSKRDPAVRAADAGGLLAWAARTGVDLTAALRRELAEGFGDDASGEDRYDAVLGLFGMLEVLTGGRPPGVPADDVAVTSVEGWILGLDPADVAEPRIVPAIPPTGRAFVIAKNPDHRSNLPYLLSLPVEGGPLLLKARETWPRTSKVYCHPLDVWPADADIVERVAVKDCRRRGAAIDLVLDRPRENRSQIVFTSGRGRQMIFWQTPRTTRQARPGARIPTARASGRTDLSIVADTRERYAYRFSRQQVQVEQRALRVGDYATEQEGEVVAAVERKSVEDLAARLVDGQLAFTLADLASLPRAAVVVEGSYADLFKLDHVRAGFVADQLAKVQVRYPSVPIMFCGTRKLAEEWTFRFLGAAGADVDRDPD
ncbi:MAG TPA: ERCC4 domain-containing protein [Nitriliruptorales bacterium]